MGIVSSTIGVTENYIYDGNGSSHGMSMSTEAVLISICGILLFCFVGPFIGYWYRKERVYKRTFAENRQLSSPLLDAPGKIDETAETQMNSKQTRDAGNSYSSAS